MKRLTVEEVVTAFKETGLRPQRGVYLGEEKEGKATCGCGLGAVFAHTEKMYSEEDADDADRSITNYFDALLGDDYRMGFVHGFDGEKASKFFTDTKLKTQESILRYLHGYDDGKSAYEAVAQEVK